MANKQWLWGIVLGIAVAVTGYLVMHFNDPQRGYRESGEYRVFLLEGRDAPIFEAKIVGKEAPFSHDQIDKPTMFVFFGTFCPHCKGQMPVTETLAKKFGERAHVFAVNGREFGNMPMAEREKRVADYLAENGWAQTPTLIASVEMQEAFNLEAVPSVILIDGSKKIRYVGLGNHSESRLESLLEEAL